MRSKKTKPCRRIPGCRSPGAQSQPVVEPQHEHGAASDARAAERALVEVAVAGVVMWSRRGSHSSHSSIFISIWPMPPHSILLLGTIGYCSKDYLATHALCNTGHVASGMQHDGLLRPQAPAAHARPQPLHNNRSNAPAPSPSPFHYHHHPIHPPLACSKAIACPPPSEPNPPRHPTLTS